MGSRHRPQSPGLRHGTVLFFLTLFALGVVGACTDILGINDRTLTGGAAGSMGGGGSGGGGGTGGIDGAPFSRESLAVSGQRLACIIKSTPGLSSFSRWHKTTFAASALGTRARSSCPTAAAGSIKPVA